MYIKKYLSNTCPLKEGISKTKRNNMTITFVPLIPI